MANDDDIRRIRIRLDTIEGEIGNLYSGFRSLEEELKRQIEALKEEIKNLREN